MCNTLAWPKLLPHSAFGLLAGAGLMGLAAALMAAAGSYRIEGVDASASLWFPLLMVGIAIGARSAPALLLLPPLDAESYPGG